MTEACPVMDETDPSDHSPIFHYNSKQLGPEFPEAARCWCRAEQGRGKAAVLNPSRIVPKLEFALPHGWCLMQKSDPEGKKRNRSLN